MTLSKVQLAAQADLVLLTVEMLRPPLAFSAAKQSEQLEQAEGKPDWTRVEADQLNALLLASGLVPSRLDSNVSLADALREVYDQVRELTLDEWSDEYWRLFDSSMACPINEAAYIRRDKGTILGDLAGFYRAFGWRPNPATGERPDHLLTQLEFVAVLLAASTGTEQIDQRQIVTSGLNKFADVHLQDWVPSFCLQLCDSTRLAFYGAVSQWLLRFWEALVATHVWLPQTPGAEGQRLTPEAEQENPYECAANGLVQLGEH